MILRPEKCRIGMAGGSEIHQRMFVLLLWYWCCFASSEMATESAHEFLSYSMLRLMARLDNIGNRLAEVEIKLEEVHKAQISGHISTNGKTVPENKEIAQRSIGFQVLKIMSDEKKNIREKLQDFQEKFVELAGTLKRDVETFRDTPKKEHLNISLQTRFEEISSNCTVRNFTRDSDILKKCVQFGEGEEEALVDGGWSNWSKWTQCSSTCGTGLQLRKRACTSPEPRSGGKYCLGESSEYQLCDLSKCSDRSKAVGFSLLLPDTTDTARLKFKESHYNPNNVYNMSSGEFICQKSGLYAFILNLIRTPGNETSTYCYLNKHSKFRENIISGYSYVESSRTSTSTSYSSTSSFLYDLQPGDRVYLSECVGTHLLHPWSSFAGFIVHEFDD